jgi:hypothetical protein
MELSARRTPGRRHASAMSDGTLIGTGRRWSYTAGRSCEDTMVGPMSARQRLLTGAATERGWPELAASRACARLASRGRGTSSAVLRRLPVSL